jgi:hypothetical protein
MNPSTFVHSVIRSGLRFMAATLGNARVDSPEAELLLLAIALQESGCTHRAQIKGPARGYWQFERGGGFGGILAHPRTGPLIKTLIDELDLPGDADELWQALPQSELLQTCFARLLLWSDNAPLPAIGAKDTAWAIDLRNWRPGKPGRDRWDVSYQGALDVVKAAGAPIQPADAAVPALFDQVEHLIRRLRSALA